MFQKQMEEKNNGNGPVGTLTLLSTSSRISGVPLGSYKYFTHVLVGCCNCLNRQKATALPGGEFVCSVFTKHCWPIKSLSIKHLVNNN